MSNKQVCTCELINVTARVWENCMCQLAAMQQMAFKLRKRFTRNGFILHKASFRLAHLGNAQTVHNTYFNSSKPDLVERKGGTCKWISWNSVLALVVSTLAHQEGQAGKTIAGFAQLCHRKCDTVIVNLLGELLISGWKLMPVQQTSINV